MRLSTFPIRNFASLCNDNPPSTEHWNTKERFVFRTNYANGYNGKVRIHSTFTMVRSAASHSVIFHVISFMLVLNSLLVDPNVVPHTDSFEVTEHGCLVDFGDRWLNKHFNLFIFLKFWTPLPRLNCRFLSFEFPLFRQALILSAGVIISFLRGQWFLTNIR